MVTTNQTKEIERLDKIIQEMLWRPINFKQPIDVFNMEHRELDKLIKLRDELKLNVERETRKLNKRYRKRANALDMEAMI
jgi:hypothetical protein